MSKPLQVGWLSLCDLTLQFADVIEMQVEPLWTFHRTKSFSHSSLPRVSICRGPF